MEVQTRYLTWGTEKNHVKMSVSWTIFETTTPWILRHEPFRLFYSIWINWTLLFYSTWLYRAGCSNHEALQVYYESIRLESLVSFSRDWEFLWISYLQFSTELQPGNKSQNTCFQILTYSLLINVISFDETGSTLCVRDHRFQQSMLPVR
jgi:hypothetical protein